MRDGRARPNITSRRFAVIATLLIIVALASIWVGWRVVARMVSGESEPEIRLKTASPEEQLAARREAAEQLSLIEITAPPPLRVLPAIPPSAGKAEPIEIGSVRDRELLSSVQLAPVEISAPAGSAVEMAPIKLGDLPLEQQRKREESAAADADIRIVMGFECSEELRIKKVSPTHFIIDVDTRRVFRNWFLFRIEGAAGRTVRIDFKNAQLWKWSTLNPVYSYVTDLDDPANFVSEPVTDPRPLAAANGPILPDTSGQQWHFISQVWMPPSRPRIGTLSMVQTFEQDSAYVAMKYPYTPGYNEAYLASLEGNPYAQVITIGHSEEGRPLQMVKIGGDDEADKVRPCVLLYAREHSTEHDTSWVVQGAIQFLTSDAPEAVRLRERMTFLLIPVLDPDGAVAGVYDHLNASFRQRNAPPEALAYAGWFERWVDKGKRLDIALNLHNMESAEMGHFVCIFIDPGRPEPCMALHEAILSQFEDGAYKARKRVGEGYTTTQLNGYLGYFYGPLPLLYEVNSQEKERHLTINDLREIGRRMAIGCGEYFATRQADAALAGIEYLRAGRRERLEDVSPGLNPIERAYRLKWNTVFAKRELERLNN